MPRRIYETYQKVNQAKDHLLQKLGRTPRADEIADYLNIGTETVLEIIESWNAFNIQSFDRNAYEEDDMELYETIGDVDSTYERIENKDFLEKSLDKFNTAEKEFIDLRYFKRKTQKTQQDGRFANVRFEAGTQNPRRFRACCTHSDKQVESVLV